jgi:hypothetical protein
MTKKLLVLFLFLTVAVFATGTSYAFEGWNFVTMHHQINDSTAIELYEDTRTNDNWGYRYEHIDFGIFYKANSWLELAANYRAFQQNWKALGIIGGGYVSAPHLNAKIHGKVSGIILFNNFRLMYDTGQDLLLWWNTSGALFPVEMNNGSILTPFVKVHPFIGLTSRGIYNLRTDIGVNYKFANTKWIVPSVFYVNEYRNLDRIAQDYSGIVLDVTLNLQ